MLLVLETPWGLLSRCATWGCSKLLESHIMLQFSVDCSWDLSCILFPQRFHALILGISSLLCASTRISLGSVLCLPRFHANILGSLCLVSSALPREYPGITLSCVFCASLRLSWDHFVLCLVLRFRAYPGTCKSCVLALPSAYHGISLGNWTMTIPPIRLHRG